MTVSSGRAHGQALRRLPRYCSQPSSSSAPGPFLLSSLPFPREVCRLFLALPGRDFLVLPGQDFLVLPGRDSLALPVQDSLVQLQP